MSISICRVELKKNILKLYSEACSSAYWNALFLRMAFANVHLLSSSSTHNSGTILVRLSRDEYYLTIAPSLWRGGEVEREGRYHFFSPLWRRLTGMWPETCVRMCVCVCVYVCVCVCVCTFIHGLIWIGHKSILNNLIWIPYVRHVKEWMGLIHGFGVYINTAACMQGTQTLIHDKLKCVCECVSFKNKAS